ncbi:MAG TPA: TetR/AcrR family transcriptional regulator [Streptosporangiaceae bacterium]
MNERPPTPTGLARRSRRLSDQETRDRMLRAAVEMISRTGLTVSLDHISFEDIIRDAGVSRSTVYRHWPYKDLFFSDLVLELARNASPTIIRAEIRLMKQVLAEHVDWLETPELRHSLILELIRRLAPLDFETVLGSPEWRTYLALHATVSSLTDHKLREEIQAALGQADAAHIARVARAWQQLTDLFGYRLRPELAVTFETFATLLNATMRGLVVTALSSPEVATHQTAARPFGAAETSPWSLPALGIAGVATAFLEPDPDTEWDDGRFAAILRVLDAWQPPDPTP